MSSQSSTPSAMLDTPGDARLYLWSWFTWTLSFATALLTVMLSPAYPLFIVPAVPFVIGGWNLERLADKIVKRSPASGAGFFARQWRAAETYQQLSGKEGFVEALRLLNLPTARWFRFRHLAYAFLGVAVGIAIVSEILEGFSEYLSKN